MATLIFGTLPDLSGSGYGYGDKGYVLALIDAFAARLSQACRDRLAELRKLGATIAFWRSDEKGRPCNGGSGEPVKPGDVQETPGPLSLCGRGTLHATLRPEKWKGGRIWLVALLGQTVGDEEKMGALKREIIGECK